MAISKHQLSPRQYLMASGFGDWVVKIEANIPDYMWESLFEYIVDGTPTGDFLRAVLTNEPWKTVMAKADDDNQKALHLYWRVVVNAMPNQCQGSSKNYNSWINMGGLRGMQAAQPKEEENE